MKRCRHFADMELMGSKGAVVPVAIAFGRIRGYESRNWQ